MEKYEGNATDVIIIDLIEVFGKLTRDGLTTTSCSIGDKNHFGTNSRFYWPINQSLTEPRPEQSDCSKLLYLLETNGRWTIFFNFYWNEVIFVSPIPFNSTWVSIRRLCTYALCSVGTSSKAFAVCSFGFFYLHQISRRSASITCGLFRVHSA